MATFDNRKISLQELLRDIEKGKIQLPDFQRGWVWDDDHIRELLVSVARSFPIGAVMMLQTGGEIRFQTRMVEGLEKKVDKPELLILDGQQRLTTLTQTIQLMTPVQTRTGRGNPIQRYYYFDIEKSLSFLINLDEAIIAVDEKKQLWDQFGKNLELDLSSIEKECENMHFPCNQIMNSNKWEMTLNKLSQEKFSKYMEFREKILESFRTYQLPIIELNKETSKEAVCTVFEKVNTGGVPLSVFELITASYAADGYNLRDDWFGSEQRKVSSRQMRIRENPLLEKIAATDFLQAITLLHTHNLKQQDLNVGKKGKEVHPVSARRSEILQLPLSAWREYADKVEAGFKLTGKFLQQESFHHSKEIAYSSQLVPLAAVLSILGEKWLEPKIYNKLTRWFWNGILGELYGGSVDTRIANDYEELLCWFENDEQIPRTIKEAFFQPERLESLRTRSSAAYKGINVLILREGAKDWFFKASVNEMDIHEIALDIHHIFPIKWCNDHGIKKDIYDSILNKTSLSYKVNRKIGGKAPSIYLLELQKEVNLSNKEIDKLLESHALSSQLLRQDRFDDFINDRREKLMTLINLVMEKGTK